MYSNIMATSFKFLNSNPVFDLVSTYEEQHHTVHAFVPLWYVRHELSPGFGGCFVNTLLQQL